MLESNLAAAKKEIADLTSKPTRISYGYKADRIIRYIPDEAIHFQIGDDPKQVISCRIVGESLVVSGVIDTLRILPVASNSIKLMIEKWV